MQLEGWMNFDEDIFDISSGNIRILKNAVEAMNGIKQYSNQRILDNAVQPNDVFINSDSGWLYYYNPIENRIVGVAGQNTVATLKQQIVNLQSQITAINARLDGKELDIQNTVDIKTASQTTGYIAPSNNGLGGQISGNGINALLGNTGLVTVDGESVFDNRGALGLEIGLEPMQPYDVKDGQIITSSGMNDIYYTPYKAA